MHYFIDGYNLLFRTLRAGNNLQLQREWIIQDLSNKIKFLGLDASIIFDSQYQAGDSTKRHINNFEITFTAEGETADEFIINELKTISDPRTETVVTSDKKLAWRARRKAAHSLTVEEFIEWLNRRYKKKIRENNNNEISKTTANPIKTAPQPIPPEPVFPLKQATLEECLSYYEEVFLKEYAELVKKETPKKSLSPSVSKHKPKKIKIVKEPTEIDARTNMERWLDIFEQRLSRENE